MTGHPRDENMLSAWVRTSVEALVCGHPRDENIAVCQASYQNGSDMRPREVQKLDCRLRELAQLQINTGNAKKTCFLVFGYTGVF